MIKNNKKSIIRTFLPILLVGLLTVVTSCGTKRAATEATGGRNANWTTFYAPVTVDIDDPMSMRASGRVTMEKDNYIHLSMRFLGMEVAVLYVDSDSLYFVDKYHHYLFAEPLKTILGSKYENMSLGEIQQIMLGQKTIPTSDRVMITPSIYVNTPAGHVASKMSVVVSTKQADMSGTWTWNEYEAKWNEPERKVSFKVPDNYKRITMDSAMSVLKSLSL